MDLSERPQEVGERHPWEQSRARAVEQIVKKAGSVQSILDIGCGDAYASRLLLEGFGATSLVGVDVHLTAEQCQKYGEGDHRIELFRDVAAVGARQFDLALLCDVIEHVEDDVALLRTTSDRVRSGGHILVTVPAFQLLFSDQDRALKHYRRYTLSQLETSVRGADLEVVASGYLFSSLLPVRALGKLFELVGRGKNNHGIGDWRGGRLLTSLMTNALSADNAVLLALAERRIKLPGLSAWALCART